MNKTNNEKLTGISKVLRRNMTPEERRLWYDFLKKLPVTINRQKVFGDYIVDFYCAQAKIVIELDGSQHYDPDGLKNDCERDRYLSEHGITVLRYSNADIHRKFDCICLDILKHIDPTLVI